MQIYHTGVVTIIHPSFVNRGLIKQVLSELGVDPNSKPIVIPTKNFNNIIIREIRNSLFLKNDNDI